MIRILLTLLVIGTWNVGITFGQKVSWAHSEGGPFGQETGRHVVVDSKGNAYVAGNYRQFCKFSGVVFPNSGDDDAFLAKYNADGDFVYVRLLGGTQTDRYLGLDVDSQDNLICAGYAKLGIIAEGPEHAWDGIVIKYDPLGNVQWLKQIDGTVYTQGEDVATDEFDNVYVAGAHAGDSYFPNDTITSNGNADVYLIKYTESGVYQWGLTAGGSGADGASHVEVASNQDVILGGFFKDTLHILGDSAISAGYQDIFLSRLDPQGNLLWLKTYGGDSNDLFSGLTTADDGSIYITGYFRDTIHFGGVSLVSNGDYDGYVARLDANGDAVWAVNFGSPVGGDFPHGVFINENHTLAATGQYFSDSTIIGPDTLYDGGSGNIFLTEIDTSGSINWAKGYGSPASLDIGYGLYVDPNDNIFNSGYFGGNMSFDTIPVTTEGLEDIFVYKYGRARTMAISSIDGANFCRGSSFAVELKLTGCFDSANVFYVELSDTSGSFAGATDTIGTYSGVYGGQLTVTIPDSATPGTTYRIRFRSTLPAGISPDNGTDITIAAPNANSIVISGDSTICAGDSVQLTATAGFSTYSWSTGDNTMQIMVFNPGTFFVTATDTNGCQNSDSHHVATCVSIDKPIEILDWKLYPNPTYSNQFSVEGPKNQQFSIQIFDLQGKQLFTKRNQKGTLNIDATEFPTGYVVVTIDAIHSKKSKLLKIVR